MEVGFPNEFEALLLSYCEHPGDNIMLYVNVPAATIRAIVAKHMGLTENSGSLPDMIEVDESGCQWAAAAESPTESSDDDTWGSPTSAVHLGAIPPPPPLLEIEVSPIVEQTNTPTTETPTLNATTMNDLGEAVLYVDDMDVGVFEEFDEQETKEKDKDKDS